MKNHGIKIEKCPRCSKQGLLIERLTVTTNENKKYTYRKLNAAHYLGNGISKNGKLVDRIHWCYLNMEQIKQLQTQGVRQKFTQNVTQNVRQNENPNLGLFSENIGSARESSPSIELGQKGQSFHSNHPGECQDKDHLLSPLHCATPHNTSYGTSSSTI